MLNAFANSFSAEGHAQWKKYFCLAGGGLMIIVMYPIYTYHSLIIGIILFPDTPYMGAFLFSWNTGIFRDLLIVSRLVGKP